LTASHLLHCSAEGRIARHPNFDCAAACQCGRTSAPARCRCRRLREARRQLWRIDDVAECARLLPTGSQDDFHAGLQSAGIHSPRSKRRYFSAVQACCSRHSSKSASVRFDKNTRHAGFECCSSFVKARRGTSCAFARPRARIEATPPFPPRRGAGIADALHDGAGVHVAIVDAPAFLREVTIVAAGEGGHALLKRGLRRRANGAIG
jgi:hypothetical protein